MKYLCLVYLEDMPTEGAAALDAITAEVIDFRDALRSSGYEVASSSLQPAHAATTIQVRNGQLLMADGPFTGSNEQLDGFYLIEAGDLNDAIRVAARMPSARVGNIEIRPVRELQAARSPQEHPPSLSQGDAR